MSVELRAALAIVRDADRKQLETLTPLMLRLQRPLPLVNGIQALVSSLAFGAVLFLLPDQAPSVPETFCGQRPGGPGEQPSAGSSDGRHPERRRPGVLCVLF